MIRKSSAGAIAVAWAALLPDAGTKVVCRFVVTLVGLTHWTEVQGRIFVPWMVMVRAGLPAGALSGGMVRPGSGTPPDGVDKANGSELDVPFTLDTVTTAVPGRAACATEMGAVICVALTKVVAAIGAPFQFTLASLVKFVPFTVSVKPCVLQDGVEAPEVVDAESDVSAGEVAGTVEMVNSTTFETSLVVVALIFCVGDCAEPGIRTDTCTVPAVARFDAGTGAVS